ncbi:MAG: ATP-binding cassette domain-containing protein [Ruminococcaceae bacterium]|nr:ATP-binding cassette domain-containing protein [Oscillospiraceae bacterium]
MNSPWLLETRNLKKYFPAGPGMTLHALDGINLRIRPGRTLGVVGESGCGKSTLGRTILRLTEPTEGQIFLNGREITGMGKRELRKLRTKMQIIFQDPYASLNPRMTIEDSIAEPMLVNGLFRTKAEAYGRVDELMEIVGLAPRNASLFPHEISGGLRQRVGIARALATNPEFIVCDEPVSALDVSIQAQILNLLMDLQDQMGMSYLFITHDLSVVKHISHDIAVMYLGQCVESGSTEEIFRHPAHPYTKALLASIPTPSLSTRDKEPQIIRGEVVSPINPAPGCRFAARCPYATDCCREPQQEREIREGHFVMCYRAEELAE